MHVLLYTDSLNGEWYDLLRRESHQVTQMPLGAIPANVSAHDVCVFVNAEPVLPSYRFWLKHIPISILLITSALTQAEALSLRIRHLHLIAHPSQALGSLSQLLELTRLIHVGTVTLGPKFLDIGGGDAITTH